MAKIDDDIRKLCEEKGLKFKPWEWPPVWDPDIEGPCIWSDSGCGGAIWWPKGQKIRRELIAEIKTAAKKGKVAT